MGLLTFALFSGPVVSENISASPEGYFMSTSNTTGQHKNVKFHEQPTAAGQFRHQRYSGIESTEQSTFGTGSQHYGQPVYNHRFVLYAKTLGPIT
ncbi:hypothetical protein HUJ04_009719 [Dendroctonus ponderosae]|nr:hypothetical protein HUJ04_009719 [Dendroctonus ponderosae]